MASNILQSPGVLVSIVDESNYVAGVGVNTPLIIVATADNKTYNQRACAGTLESGVVRTITSPNQLLQMYGSPVFYKDEYGNKLHGAANNEYALLAAFNYLSLGNSCYILRADVDTSFPDLDVLTPNNWTASATNQGTGNITNLNLGHGSSIPEVFTMIYDGVYFQINGSITGTPIDAITGKPNKLILPNRPYSSAGSVKGGINFTIKTGTVNFNTGDIFTLNTFYDSKNVVSSPNGFISNITASNTSLADSITVTITQSSTNSIPGKFVVRGQYSGYIGTGVIGNAFVNSRLSFIITELSNGQLKVGDTFSFEIFMNTKVSFAGFGNGSIENISLLPYSPTAETWNVIAKAALNGDILVQPADITTKPDGKISDITFFDKLNDSKNPDHVTQTDTFTLTCVSDVANLQFTRSSSAAKDNLKIKTANNASISSYTLKAKTLIDESITGNISQAISFTGGVNVNPIVDKFKFVLSKSLKLVYTDKMNVFPFIVSAISNASQFFGSIGISSSNGWDIENWMNTIYGPGTLNISNITNTQLGNKPIQFNIQNAIDIRSSSVNTIGTASIDMIDIMSIEKNLDNWKQIILSSPTAALAIRCTDDSVGSKFDIISKSGFASNVQFAIIKTGDPLSPDSLTITASIGGSPAIELFDIVWSTTPDWKNNDTFSIIVRPQVFIIDNSGTKKVNYVNIGGNGRDILDSDNNVLFNCKISYPSLMQFVANVNYNTYFGLCRYTITDVTKNTQVVTVCNTTPRVGTNTFVTGSGLQFTWQYASTLAAPYPTDKPTTNWIGSSMTFIGSGNVIGTMNDLVLSPVIDDISNDVTKYVVMDSDYNEIEYINSYIRGLFELDPVKLDKQILTVGDTFNMSESVNGFDVSKDGVLVGEVTSLVPYSDNPIYPTIEISIDPSLLTKNPYLATDIYSFNIAPSSFEVVSLAIGNLTDRYGKVKIGEQYNFNVSTQKYGDAPLSLMISQGNDTKWKNGDIIQIKSIVNTFSVIGTISGDHGNAVETDPGVWEFDNEIISFTITQGLADSPWVAGDSFAASITKVSTPKYPNTETDAKKRELIVSKMAEAVKNNEDIRTDTYLYSLAVAPGYHELGIINALEDLAASCRYEFAILSHTPYWLSPEQAQVWANTAERFRLWNIFYYYAHGLSTNVDGETVFVDGTSVALAQLALADVNYPVWFAPMASKRGKISTLSYVGYIQGELGTPTTFVHTPVSENQRGLLYGASVNPASEITGKGILMMGQKTSQSEATSLDRINAARLVIQMKREIRFALFSYLGEPNDNTTRSNVAAILSEYLTTLLQGRALYDYAIISDSSNNTPNIIDNNRMVVDIIVKLSKSVEFIYVPLHIRSTGGSMSL